MRPNLDRLADTAMNAVASAVYVIAGIVILGRALNSATAMRLAEGRFGAPLEASRRAVNQVYDVSGQD
jgi:hypothetical protein